MEVVRLMDFTSFAPMWMSLQKFIPVHLLIKNELLSLWHARLGHPSLPILRSLIPTFFSASDHIDFKCVTQL